MSEPHWSDDVGPAAAHPDAAGWVLGALDPDDAQRFAEHLETCAACREAVQDLQKVRVLMGSAAPPVDVPPGLAARTLRAVELAAAADGRRRRVTRLLAVAAAVVVLAAGGLAYGTFGGDQGRTVTIAMRAPSGAATGTATGHDTANGWSVVLSVRGLPPIPEGHGHYECWYVAASDAPGHPDAVSAGSFEVAADGTATGVRMWTVVDLEQQKGTVMVVTREPDSDPARTGPVVLSGPVRV